MKRLSITLNDLFNLPSAVIYNPDLYNSAAAVTIDSRNINKDSLFVAVKGERFDGHDFVKEAVKKGASCVLIDEIKYERFKNLSVPFVTVKNTVNALGDLACIWRNKLNTKIIALTGSAGKTTTKEILSVLLSERFSVNKTAANNNNHIGVPLTILNTSNKHEVLVLEIGTNHFGEVAYSANIARPDFAVITNIGNSHLEFLKNKKGVFKEKIELFEATVSRNKYIFINSDDELLSGSYADYDKKISYGFNNYSDVAGKILGYGDMGNPLVEITYRNKKVRQMIPLYGEQSAKNYLAAVAVAFKLGLGKTEIEKATDKLKAYDKRLNVREHKNYLLIDDTYNANPDSMMNTIELLGKIKKYGKKIAVLGDMFELGNDSVKQHKNLSRILIKNKIDTVLSIGRFMKEMDGSLGSSVISHKHFSRREKLKASLKNLNLSGSAILIKGSRGMKMEEFVNALEAEAFD